MPKYYVNIAHLNAFSQQAIWGGGGLEEGMPPSSLANWPEVIHLFIPSMTKSRGRWVVKVESKVKHMSSLTVHGAEGAGRFVNVWKKN